MSVVAADISFVQALFGLLLAGLIVTLAIVDLKKMILPDQLNLLLAGAGTAQSVALRIPNLIDAALGAIAAAGWLALVMISYRQLRGVDGLGLGDLKFATAASIWIGWQGVPLMLLVASASALLVIAAYAFKERKLDRLAPLPFGPFLGLGTVSAWVMMVAS